MELLTIWDLKRLIVSIATIIRADVMIVFLNTVKNVRNVKLLKQEEIKVTLCEFSEMCFSCPDSSVPATIYVFDDEEYADHWLNGEEDDVYIALVICSAFRPDVWLKDRWANAKVEHFHCVSKDTLAVVIDTNRQESKR